MDKSYRPMGTQPVRVLEQNVLAWFEGKYPEFRRELEQIGKDFGVTRTIKYFCNEAPILGHQEGDMIPYVRFKDGQIGIHETFLSYVWALSYGFLVIFDEQIHGPHIAKQPKHGKSIGHFLDLGYRVLNYGLDLLTEFKKWPDDLPNPDTYTGKGTYFPGRTNAIYLAAVDFILCHEVAHIACGHLRREKETQERGEYITRHEVKQFELEADKWAVERVSRGIRLPERSQTVVGFGIVAGLGSLLFLNRELTSSTHPDKNDRIRTALLALAIDDLDSLWGITAAFYIVWSQRFNFALDFSGEFDTYKVLVDHIDAQLAEIKRDEKSRRFRLD